MTHLVGFDNFFVDEIIQRSVQTAEGSVRVVAGSTKFSHVNIDVTYLVQKYDVKVLLQI